MVDPAPAELLAPEPTAQAIEAWQLSVPLLLLSEVITDGRWDSIIKSGAADVCRRASDILFDYPRRSPVIEGASVMARYKATLMELSADLRVLPWIRAIVDTALSAAPIESFSGYGEYTPITVGTGTSALAHPAPAPTEQIIEPCLASDAPDVSVPAQRLPE